MYYHSFILLPNSGCSVTLNKTKEYVLFKIIKPYINNEITLEKYDDLGSKILFNQSSGVMLSLFKSAEKMDDRLSQYDGRGFLKKIKQISDIQNCTEALINDYRTSRSGIEASSYLQKLFSPVKEQVFVIMKFGDKHLDSAYEGVIKPTIKDFGLKAIRIDEIQNSGVISEQILRHISESKYVIADLSGERPNCYYEAGFAHALGKELILTIRHGDRIHFDLSGHRFFQWETEMDLRHFLKKRFNSLMSMEQGQAIHLIEEE